MPYISDDALISLRYANRFINGLGLTWTNGIPVEGYSNLLWILLISVLGKLGVNLIVAVRLLGLLFTFSNIYLIINYVSKRYNNSVSLLTTLLIFYSFAGTVIIWSIAGLEQPLVGFLVIYAIIRYLDYKDFNNPTSLYACSVALGLLAITRPDGILLAFSIFLYQLFNDKLKNRSNIIALFRLLLLPTLFFLSQIVFRYYYYGEILPNTALVKITPSLHHLWEGVHYNLRFIKANLTLSFLIAFLIALLIKSKQKRIYLYLTILIIWWGYISFIGGDIFPAFRHHILTYSVLLLIMADGLQFLYAKYSKKYILPLMTIAIALFIFQQYTEVYYTVQKNETWEWEMKSLSKDLVTAFGKEKPLIAVDAAGALPYWTEFPAVDMLGLNDYNIPRHKPKNIGSGYLGHELGNAEYVLNKNPDLIQFHIGKNYPVHHADSLLFNNEKFKNRYVPVLIFSKGEYNYKGYLWFNKFSSKLGLITKENEVIIPGYLFTGNSIASIDSISKFVLNIKNNQTVRFTLPELLKINTITTIPDGLDIKTIINSDKKTTTIEISNKIKQEINLEKVILSF